jgi:tRNA A-37 threonylcarbamoyl transferase component Bud32
MIQKNDHVLRFDNLKDYLLHKNGNYLYKVPFRGGWAVLKVYFGDQSKFRYIHKTYNNLVYNNKSSFMPKQRRLTELECLQIWREAGFRVFDTYDDVVVEGLPEGGYALFEYIEARRFKEYFADAAVPLEERLVMWRRFLPVWHRRHALAIEQREPKLVHENGDLKHVLIMDDGQFLFFDFEMVFRSRGRIEEFVAREIVAYLKSLCNNVARHEWLRFIKETLDHYPDRALLESVYDFSFHHPNPLLRFGRSMDRIVKPRARKPFSKYNVALKLHTMGEAMQQVSRFVDRGGELLNFSKRGDGTHCIIKLMDESTPMVLKLYGSKRSGMRSGLKKYLSPFDVGQSSSSTRARFQTEREVLALWQREGFDVPAIYAPAFLAGFDQPCIAMEWIPGQTLTTFLNDVGIPLDRKRDVISRFCQEMARRHERALALQEVRLLLFHPNLSRILVSNDRLVYLDFEVVYTPKYDLERVARKEIAGFVYSIGRSAPRQQLHPLLECFINAYPDKKRMALVLEELRRFGTIPVYGWLKLLPFVFSFYGKYRKSAAYLNDIDASTATRGIP